MIFEQQQRPLAEQGMSQSELNWLDLTRMQSAARRAAQPELFAQLDRIETMLKQLL